MTGLPLWSLPFTKTRIFAGTPLSFLLARFLRSRPLPSAYFPRPRWPRRKCRCYLSFLARLQGDFPLHAVRRAFEIPGCVRDLFERFISLLEYHPRVMVSVGTAQPH